MRWPCSPTAMPPLRGLRCAALSRRAAQPAPSSPLPSRTSLCGAGPPPAHSAAPLPRVLFLVEGFTDIRFVAGLSAICTLTMITPSAHYRQSSLLERVRAMSLAVKVVEIEGGRAAFQLRSLRWSLRHVRRFDLILAQELTRGALNANLAGKLCGVPVFAYLCTSPIEYFRCRRERGQIGLLKTMLGALSIRLLMRLNARLASSTIALGVYLEQLAKRDSRRVMRGLYYGVDTERFRPANQIERRLIRERLDLPKERFLIVFASRISHEKDPETVLRAAALMRERGFDAVVLNLGGGWRDFLELARSLDLADHEAWVMARPAAHPITEFPDYLRAADALAQASLAEGAGLAPLEALACGVPVVATAVGGLARELGGLAHLVPRRDFRAMADELLWIASHPAQARGQAIRGREYVIREWGRGKAFADLACAFASVTRSAR